MVASCKPPLLWGVPWFPKAIKWPKSNLNFLPPLTGPSTKPGHFLGWPIWYPNHQENSWWWPTDTEGEAVMVHLNHKQQQAWDRWTGLRGVLSLPGAHLFSFLTNVHVLVLLPMVPNTQLHHTHYTATPYTLQSYTIHTTQLHHTHYTATPYTLHSYTQYTAKCSSNWTRPFSGLCCPLSELPAAWKKNVVGYIRMHSN